MGASKGGQVSTPPPPHQIDRDSEAMDSVVHEGYQVKKPTPLTRMDRDNRAAFSGVGGARGGRTQTDSLAGAAQGAVSEEAAKLVKDSTGLKVKAEVGRCREKKWIGGMGENIIFVRTGH